MKTRAEKIRHNIKWFIPVVFVTLPMALIYVCLERLVDFLKKYIDQLPKLYHLNEN